jgi:hypothetical protein
VQVKSFLPILNRVIALAQANAEYDALGHITDIAGDDGPKQLEANKFIVERVAPVHKTDTPIVNINAGTVTFSSDELVRAQRELLYNNNDVTDAVIVDDKGDK